MKYPQSFSQKLKKLLNRTLVKICIMKKILITLLLSVPFILSGQDLLELTIHLDGFKKNESIDFQVRDTLYQLEIELGERKSLTFKIDEPVKALLGYKKRVTSVWLEPGSQDLFISKSNFPKNVSLEGSKSEDLWNGIIAAEPEQKAILLEENIKSPVVETYLMNGNPNLKPEDLKRLRAKMPNRVNDIAKYDVRVFKYDKKEAVKEGDQIFDFIALTSNDEIIDTKAYRGKYLLLDFAGTSCGWCWVSYPKMQEALPEYENLGVITFNNDYSIDRWEKIADRNNVNLPWPVLWKAENKREIFEKYGVNVYPTYVLISPDGKILEYWRGSREEKLKNRLERHIVD